MSFNPETFFRKELRQLIDKHIGPSSSFKDYVKITEELERETNRLEQRKGEVSERRSQCRRERVGE